MTYQIIPNALVLEERARLTPDYMRPNESPYIVVVEGYLNDAFCDRIVSECEQLEPYHLDGCHAETRECERPIPFCLAPMQTLVEDANRYYWNYDLDREPAAWLQTYGWGNDYPLHMDGSAGQTRKLTGILLLTDPEKYGGGDLVIHVFPETVTIPKTRGTVVMFPFWMWHEVTSITRGKRQTINMGFYGPPFR